MSPMCTVARPVTWKFSAVWPREGAADIVAAALLCDNKMTESITRKAIRCDM